MQILQDYLNNFETLLEIGNLDKLLFAENSFINKEVFLSEIKILATENYNKTKNPTINEDQFSTALFNTKLKTIENTILSLVDKNIVKKIIAEDGTIQYQINDENDFPDWLKEFLI